MIFFNKNAIMTSISIYHKTLKLLSWIVKYSSNPF